MSIRNLDRLLEPKSIAVVGASERAGSVGATVWRNLRAGNFAGTLYPINPKYRSLDGETVYARPSALPPHRYAPLPFGSSLRARAAATATSRRLASARTTRPPNEVRR